MSVSKVSAINSVGSMNSVDFYTIRKILTSNDISATQKTKFIKDNRSQIDRMVEQKISSPEFQYMMKNRPLEIFKPIKNSYTKRGDKIILSKALGLTKSQLDRYVDNVAKEIIESGTVSIPP